MKVMYEWTVEAVNNDGDIVDSDMSSSLALLLGFCPSVEYLEIETALMRIIIGDDYSGEISREYAYVVDGALPDTFPESGARIPAKYYSEYSRLKEA